MFNSCNAYADNVTLAVFRVSEKKTLTLRNFNFPFNSGKLANDLRDTEVTEINFRHYTTV